MKARGGVRGTRVLYITQGTRPPSRVHAIRPHTSQPLKRCFLKKNLGGAVSGVVLPAKLRICEVLGQNMDMVLYCSGGGWSP